MWTVTLCWMMFFTLTSGYRTSQPFKGCVSTSFVQQYAFYYRIDQPLNLEQSFAVCNHRLTKYIGLQVDISDPGSIAVYCGNDLFEVSFKLHLSQCRPCRENDEILCGEDQAMAVYVLRDSTPLAVLMTTNLGVEMLIDKSTTILVNDANNYEDKFLDYIYHRDVIITMMDKELKRSYFHPLNMEFSNSYLVVRGSNRRRGLAVDFNENLAFWGYNLEQTNLTSRTTTTLIVTSVILQHISVDPYNRKIIVFERSSEPPYIYVYHLNSKIGHSVDLEYLHIDRIYTITINIHEQLIHAVVTLKGSIDSCLVNIDYALSRSHISFRSPLLAHAAELEVFKETAVWLRKDGSTSYIYMCNMLSGCKSGDIKTYSTPQKIGDITIYHPEKQTPGEKWLCAQKACQYGCKADSLFTARCSCPPGMELNDVDNTTCREVTSTSPPTTMPNYESSTESHYVTSTTEVNVPKNNQELEISFKDTLFIICIVVIFLTQIGVCVCVYKRTNQSRASSDQEPQLQLNAMCSNLYEVPLTK